MGLKEKYKILIRIINLGFVFFLESLIFIIAVRFKIDALTTNSG